MDVCSRFVWLRPISCKTSATVANHMSSLYLEIGCPKVLQHDRGQEFAGAVDILMDKLHVKVIRSSVYHPQSQGKIERMHQELKKQMMYDLTKLKKQVWTGCVISLNIQQSWMMTTKGNSAGKHLLRYISEEKRILRPAFRRQKIPERNWYKGTAYFIQQKVMFLTSNTRAKIYDLLFLTQCGIAISRWCLKYYELCLPRFMRWATRCLSDTAMIGTKWQSVTTYPPALFSHVAMNYIGTKSNSPRRTVKRIRWNCFLLPTSRA